MEAITVPIFNKEGKEVDSIKLNVSVFDGVVNEAAIYQAINCFRANQRKGLAATKTRGEVSGGGKKPWKQKGTGRARVGSTRSPLWRHGGVVFGPHPRDFSYEIPEKIKNIALKSSLNAKVKDNNFIVLDEVKLDSTKTKDAAKVFSGLKINSDKKQKDAKILLLVEKNEPGFIRAMSNIGFLDTNLAINTNTYEVMSHKKLLITKQGLNALTNRLKK